MQKLLSDRKTKIAVCFDGKASEKAAFRDLFISTLQAEGGQVVDTNCDFSEPNFNPNAVIYLWKQQWDILFFAGHSLTETESEVGRIYINETESLTLGQLKYSLKTAVENGLKLAIFNSCDGLGLAKALFELQIPQVLVMREPVPDQVAQAFLSYFLDSFANHIPFYLAVRRAREQLQGL